MTSNFNNFTVYSFVQKKTCGFCQMTSQLVSRLRSISKEQMLINSCKIQNDYIRGNSNKMEVKNFVFPLKKKVIITVLFWYTIPAMPLLYGMEHCKQ